MTTKPDLQAPGESRGEPTLWVPPIGDAGGVLARNSIPPLPPKNWYIDIKGSGYVVRVQNRGRIYSDGPASAASWYNVHWAETVDTTTTDGNDSGFARSKIIAHIPASDIDNMESESPVVDNADYKSGYIYVVGMSANGDRSDHGQPQQVGAAILSQAIPPNVAHLQVSESGIRDSGAVWSRLSCAMILPNPLAGLAGVQLVLENYPNIGEITEWVTKRYVGGAGGSLQFSELAQVCRRRDRGAGVSVAISAGSGNIVGTGTKFTQMAVVGCAFEAYGFRVVITAVVDDLNITADAWPPDAPSVVAATEWEIIGLVRVYARGVSEAGIVETDLSKLPYVDVLLDGDLSASNSPTIAANSRGDAVVITFTQVEGTDIKEYRLFRVSGSGAAFATMSPTQTLSQPKLPIGISPEPMEFVDKDFTTFEKEQNQFFSYAVVAYNERDTPSVPSNIVSVGCRLNSSQDGDPTLPSRDGFKNLLFDGFIGGAGVVVGAVANVVDDSDATQDAFNFNPAIAPSTFAAAAATRLAPWTRWKYHQLGQATVFPVHVNGNEVKLAPPGGGGKQVGIKQSIGGWNHATATFHKFQVGQYVTVQIKVYTDAGVTPNGTLRVDVLQFNGVASTPALLRTRLSDDSISEVAGAYLLAASVLAAGTAAGPLKVYATFHLNGAAATDRVEFRFIWDSGTTSNLYVKEAMCNDGVELAPWTGDMGNVDMYYPVSTNPTAPGLAPGDGVGGRGPLPI